MKTEKPQADLVPDFNSFVHLECNYPWLSELHSAKKNGSFKLPPALRVKFNDGSIPANIAVKRQPVPLSEIVKFANLILSDAAYLNMLEELWNRDSDGDDYSADENYLLHAFPQYFVWKYQPTVPNIEYFWEARWIAIQAHLSGKENVSINSALKEQFKLNSRIDLEA